MPFDGTLPPTILSADMALRLKAAALLETEGWCQGLYRSDHGRCMVGALLSAAMVARDERLLIEPLLATMGFDRLADATGWNDAVGRTLAQIIARLKGDTHAA